MQTYTTVQQQLPSDPTIESFSSANQVGVAQLAIQYCNVGGQQRQLLRSCCGLTLTSSTLRTRPAPRPASNTVSSALAARVLGTGLATQPAASHGRPRELN